MRSCAGRKATSAEYFTDGPSREPSETHFAGDCNHTPYRPTSPMMQRLQSFSRNYTHHYSLASTLSVRRIGVSANKRQDFMISQHGLLKAL